MKTTAWCAWIFACLLTTGLSAQADPVTFAQSVRWYGQNSLRLEMAGKVIWIDPVTVPTSEKADVILVTHSHADHFAPGKIKRLRSASTQVWVGFADLDLPQIRPGETKTVGGLSIEAVPMYDAHVPAHHEKETGFCGFLLRAEGLTVYVAGDAGRMEELKSIRCDVAFLPLGPIYTMLGVPDAVEAALDTKATVVVPIHYGIYEGTDDDADQFVALLKARGVSAFRLVRQN